MWKVELKSEVIPNSTKVYTYKKSFVYKNVKQPQLCKSPEENLLTGMYIFLIKWKARIPVHLSDTLNS